LALAIVFPAMALGAIHTPILCITAALVAASAAFAWMHAPVVRPRLAVSVLLATGVGLILFTLFQLVPLPAPLLHLLAPRNADVWSRALLPMHLPGPSWTPLSLDPIATSIEVLRGITYVGAFLTVVRVASRRGGTLFCSAVLVISATLVGMAGLLHPAMGAERVFGIYRPETLIASRHIAPLLNSNALAAYVNIGFFIALGEGLAARTVVPRPISLAFAVVLMAIELWLASRGGMLSLLVGAALVVWMSRVAGRRYRQDIKHVTYGVLIVGSMAAIAIFVLATSDEAWNELADTSVSKVHVYAPALRMIRSSFLFGAGRGSFESAFPAFRDETGYFTYTHPENILLQWASEWGVPVTLLALAAIAWSLRPAVLFSHSRPAVGAQVALATAFLHNLVDFNSEFPGVVLAFAACAGLVTAGTGVGSFRRIDAWARHPRLVAWLPAAATVLAGLLVLSHLNDDLFSDRRKLEQAALAPEPQEAFYELVRPALLRHPAEAYMPFAGALRALVAKDESVWPWAGRALELSPVYAPAHFILARSLFRHAPSQARLEYRYAVTQAPASYNDVSNESVFLVTGPNDAMELVPEGETGLKMLRALAARMGERLPATQIALDEEILRRNPDAVDAVTRRARALALDIGDATVAPWCDGPRFGSCVEQASAIAGRLEQLEPTRCEGYLLEARATALGGDVDQAIHRLESKVDNLDDQTPCLTEMIRIANEAKRESDMTRIIDKLARVDCTDDNHCANQLLLAARMEQQFGNPRRALMFYRRARERYPFRDDIWEEDAHSASLLGLHAEALDAYMELVKRHPEHPEWTAAAARERQALVETPLRARSP